MSEKHIKKWGVTIFILSQNNKKGAISASSDHFVRWDWVKFQDNTFFAR